MRVERIELIGFKSFADKTVFNFHPGTTAIVGPNGCGKSNIVDAFKWVLGEQSAKSLRGSSMEDVIFAGSDTKKTKGMAEVTLVISDIIKQPSNDSDNSDNKDKKELSQISVTRRLYRSGESEYLMNKVPCRLKDIKDVFLDTGLELKAYSILEQGKIEDIVNSKPQDRRFLIEEVAGVMKYKVRKQEAMNKLEVAKSNLQRLQDIIAEVKRQINTIDRHARKAERYRKLFDEIKDIEVRIAKRDFKTLRDEITVLANSEDTLKSKEAEVSANVHSLEALTEEKKRLCVEHEKSLGEIRTKLYALEKENTENEGKIALLKSDCENLRERYQSLIVQDGELDGQKQSAIASIKEAEGSESEMTQEILRLENVLKEKGSNFSDFEKEITDIENDLEVQRKGLFSKAEEISNLKNEINHINLSIENISKKAEKNSQDINSINDSISSLHIAIEQTKNELIKSESELQESRKAKEDLTNKLKDKKQELAAKEEVLYKEREELAAMNSKLESLREMDKSRMNSIDEGIKTLCQVADIFETLPEYETAVEAVLGDKLSAAVVENQDEITRALQLVKEKNTKRSGFISVNPVTKAISQISETENITANSGIIGEAINFVRIREGFDKVARSLLSDVIIVDNLHTAFSLWETSPVDVHKRPPYFVTLEGEVLEPSGVVFGGSDQGVLKVKRLIKEIEKNISSRRKSISNLEKVVAAIKEEIISAENDIISVDAEISSRERHCHELRVKIENLEEEDSRLRQKQEYISLEMDIDYKEKDSLKNTLREIEQKGRVLEEEKRQIEEKIRSLQSIMSEKREVLEIMRSELTEVKLKLTSTREKMASISREIERLNAVIREIDRKKEEMQNERNRIQEVISSKEEEIREKEDILKSKIVHVGELQAEASKISETLEAKLAELELVKKQRKDLVTELESIRSELSHVEMKKMEKSMKLNYLKEDIRKSYSIEIETAEVSDRVEKEEEEKLPELKERLQAMGSVSLGTLEEYEELKQRYEFLTKQRDDLLQSIEALEDTIRKINRTSKKRLEEAFEALNEKFKEVFTILFGKGRAELQLTEGSILDAGIEIVAQPPGKRLQNMNLLSGGEKALTALSLLFAGFMIKPTPLCLLDEVDAPLDESNTERFVKLLKELAKDIQFITITHNRRTMEAADYLYGITMEEPGVSKVVSMHLTEA
jgi:chromosome segregation protein